jgi:hypothetical protein
VQEERNKPKEKRTNLGCAHRLKTQEEEKNGKEVPKKDVEFGSRISNKKIVYEGKEKGWREHKKGDKRNSEKKKRERKTQTETQIAYSR